MFKVSKSGTIQLTRGDSAGIDLVITDSKTGLPYEIKEDDMITMTLRKEPCKETPILFEKKVTGTNKIYIKPEDTFNLCYGNYVYDVQLVNAVKDVYTVVPPSLFRVLPEVTME